MKAKRNLAQLGGYAVGALFGVAFWTLLFAGAIWWAETLPKDWREPVSVVLLGCATTCIMAGCAILWRHWDRSRDA